MSPEPLPSDSLGDLPDGEMARLVSAHEWSSTPLGPIGTWPRALVNTVRTVLACRLPMYVAWGPDFTQIYNDAYRPILGDKHPALGKRSPETWPEIWPTIGPMWREVLAGNPVGFDDFKLTINRFGYEEDCWFNFSYSPLYDDGGKVGGLLVTFAETTEKVKAVQDLELERRNLSLALDAAAMGWWHYDPARDHVHWDARFAEIFGVDGTSDANEVPFNRLVPEDRDRVWKSVEASLDPGSRSRFAVDYRIEHPRHGIRWIEAHGIGRFPPEGDKPALALVGTVRDVTERRGSRLALEKSEARAKAVADRLSVALSAARMGDWSWDAKDDRVTLSTRAAEIFGVPSGHPVTWESLRERLHPEDRDRAAAAVARSVAEQDDYDIEYRVVDEAGVRWVQARGRPVYEADGSTGMVGVVQDISESKTRERALQSRTSTLEAVLATAAAIAAERDTGALVQRVTDVATRITRAHFGAFFYNVLDGAGGSYMLYTLSGVDPEHFARFPMPRATALFGPTFRGEGVLRIADVRKDPRYGLSAPHKGMPAGHLPVVSYLAVPVVSRSGEVLGGLFFGHPEPDVFTEEHEDAVGALAAQAAVAMDNARLHDQARRNLEVAENAGRMKDEFLATVSHELRTPLSSVVGWVHMLKSGQLGIAEQERALASIERNVKSQQRIIEDILDVSRIVAGKLRIDLVPLEPVVPVEGAIETLQPLLDAKHIDLVRSFDRSAVILGDSSRIQQVVWNLLANAIKYTPRGGRIKVSLRAGDGEAELRVADNGEGIDPAFLPHVFERFRQADSSTTRAHGGIGLGLAIVRHIVELHGGRVAAESDGRGKGSVFIVRIPLAAQGLRASDPGAAPASGEVNLRGARALVVEDEHDTRLVVAALLGSAGMSVTTAGNAAEAIAILENAPYDLVISDIGMPGEDGYALVRRLREHLQEALRELPAIALTAYARPEDRARALSEGFQAHLAKPAEPDRLFAAVVEVLGRARQPALASPSAGPSGQAS